MPADPVRETSGQLVKFLERYGRRVHWTEVEPAAHAHIYLRRRGRRLTMKVEQMRCLDLEQYHPDRNRLMTVRVMKLLEKTNMERFAARIVLSSLRTWAVGNDRVAFERALALLAKVEDDSPFVWRPARRCPPNPICGWWPPGPRGAYTRSHWRGVGGA